VLCAPSLGRRVGRSSCANDRGANLQIPVLPSKAAVAALRGAIDGPVPLRNALEHYRTDVSYANFAELLKELRREILRIRHGILASTAHPNRDGARSYADNALRRLREHKEATTRAAQEARAAVAPVAGPEPLDLLLRRYRLRGTRALEADLTHLDVDSLAVRVVNSPRSEPNFFPDVWLVVSTRDKNGATGRLQYLLNFAYDTVPVGQGRHWVIKPYPHFEPGVTNRLTIDTMGTLRLEDIVGCSLLIGGDRLGGKQPLQTYGKTWRPDLVRLEVNGVEVVALNTSGRGIPMLSTLDLGYPAAKPIRAPGPSRLLRYEKSSPCHRA